MTYSISVVIIVLCVLLSASGVFLIRRLVPVHLLRQNHEVGGLIFLQVGVVYAVLVGFVVVAVWEDFEDSARYVQEEAVGLRDAYRLTEQFATPAGSESRKAIAEYLRVAIDDEWATMNDHAESPKAQAAFHKVWLACVALDPQTPREEALFESLLDRLNDARDHRQLRLFQMDSSIPGFLWVLLVGGACVIISMSYFFGAESVWSQATLMALLAGTLVSLLTLTLMLDHPFSGDVHVTPKPLQELLDSLRDR
jgi:hypothetical protein